MVPIELPEPPADIVAQFTGQKVDIRYVYLEPNGSVYRRVGDGKAYPPYLFKVAETDKTISELTAASRNAGLQLYVWLPFEKDPHYPVGQHTLDPSRLTAYVLPRPGPRNWHIAFFKIG